MKFNNLVKRIDEMKSEREKRAKDEEAHSDSRKINEKF